jgi:hypothetical protein
MAHTGPDYSGKYRLQSLYGNIDSAEIAARLNSPDTHDRRGLALWIDDCEGAVIRWHTSSGGVGGGVALSTEAQRSGVQSLKCTTGNAIGDYAQIQRGLAIPTFSPLGYEISLLSNTDMDYYNLQTTIFDGTIRRIGAIRLNHTLDTMSYYNAAAGWTGFSTHCPIMLDDYTFNTMKLVVDPSSGYYIRFILNNIEYDLSAYTYNQVANATDPYYHFIFNGYTAVAANTSFYLDDGIMTIDEPI